MRIRDRGMVKWAPYKSLPEQEDYLEEMEKEKLRTEMPLLSEEELEELNNTLSSLKKGDEISLDYFENGYRSVIEGRFHFYDIVMKAVKLLDNRLIPINEIIGIRKED